jgi:hypothetical protein
MYQISQHNAAVVWQDTEIKTEAKKINPIGCAFIQLTVDHSTALENRRKRIGVMNSLILISPSKGSGLKPILSGVERRMYGVGKDL